MTPEVVGDEDVHQFYRETNKCALVSYVWAGMRV